MKEIIEIKRKEFEVIEKIGDRSYKVERKGEPFFLKKFDGDKKGFETVIRNQEILRNCGIRIPKIYLWDKNSLIFVTEYIDGQNCFDSLCQNDLDEVVLEAVFNDYYLCKKSKYLIDFNPQNFVYTKESLYYMPFSVKSFDTKRDFLTADLPLWFFTKDFVKFAHGNGIDVDMKRLANEFEMNKKMTLVAIKYYR